VAIPLIPVKTPDGLAELSTRQRRVSQRHRTVLLLVDGRRTEEQVRTLARQAGAPDGCFDELLGLGLIQLPQPAAVPAAALQDEAAHVDLPIEPVPVHAQVPLRDEAVESLLPPALTLQPESVLTDSVLGGPLTESAFEALEQATTDASLEEAREILVRAVRAEAPLAGSLTLMRLKRARSRAELAKLIDEVESRIIKPYRSLSAQQTLRRVRLLLVAQPNSATLE